MDLQFEQTWAQLRDAISVERNVSALTLAVYLLVGGAMAIYVRFLYRHCATTTSDADSITRVFPLLTLVTIGVIAVVKSSMALSLGLVGALSIVRFRAAIKEPEELIYLFLCIGIGLALGAGQPLLAVVVVTISTLFVLIMHFANRKRREQSLMLTITADADRLFAANELSVLPVLRQLVPSFSVQRMDVEDQRGQIRLLLKEFKPDDTLRLISNLRSQLTDCEISFVNLGGTA